MAKDLDLSIFPTSLSVNLNSTGTILASFEPEAGNYVNISATVTQGSSYASVSGGGSTISGSSATFTVSGLSEGSATIRVYAYRTNSVPVVEDTAYCSVTVAKQKAVITTEAAAYEDLVYSGSNQALIETAAVSNAGTVKYRLGTSGEWSSDPSTVQAKDKGSYTIQYYADATGTSYADSTVHTILANIAVDRVSLPNTTTQSYSWNGQTKTPTVTTDPGRITVTGTTEAIAPGSYTVTYALVDPGNRVWDAPSTDTSNKTKSWSISPPTVSASPVSFTVLNNNANTLTVNLTPSIGTISNIRYVATSNLSPATATVSSDVRLGSVRVSFKSTSVATYTFTLSMYDIAITRNSNTVYVDLTKTITVSAISNAWLRATLGVSDGNQYLQVTPYVCVGGAMWIPAEIYIKS